MRWSYAFVIAATIISTPAKANEWWWIGLNGDSPARVLTYVDKSSVAQVASGTLRVWTLAVGEKAMVNGQQHQATHYAVRCKEGTFAAIGRIGYDAAGSKMPLADPLPSEFTRPVSASIGESVMDLVCGRPSGMEVRVASPVQHAISYLNGETAPNPEAAKQPSMSVGTGFFIGSRGEVLTSYHVIEGAQRIDCRTADGKFHPATVSRLSRANDLALLRVNLRPKSYLSLAPAGSLQPGDRVFTVGYGAANYLGVSEPRFTDGAVSALSGREAEDAYMQISVPVQPGNSGGPLINEAGQVVGVIAAQAAVDAFLKAEGTFPQNINWAVKADYALPLLSHVSVSPKRSRQEAIQATRDSLCLIVAEG